MGRCCWAILTDLFLIDVRRMKRVGITTAWANAASDPLAAVFLAWTLFAAACATKPQETVAVRGNPWFHYTQGMVALENNDQGRAMEEFDHALAQDRSFAPAFAGKALASVWSQENPAAREHRSTDVRNAKRLLGRAEDEAETQEQRFIYEVTAMRVYTALQSQQWLSEVESHRQNAQTMRKLDEEKLPYYGSKDAAAYFMGVAYYEDYRFREAEELLATARTVRAQSKWQPKISRLHDKIKRIIRASGDFALGDVAAKIAVKDEITRADLAALIVSELKLNKSPGAIPLSSEELATPIDVVGHPFQHQIDTALHWDIRGLAATYDAPTGVWLFRPDEAVSRKHLAQVFEALLIELLGEASVATSLINSGESPYLDVPIEATWFKSVSTVTSRGLMEPDFSGEFRPDDPVDGAELLLGVMKLRYVAYSH